MKKIKKYLKKIIILLLCIALAAAAWFYVLTPLIAKIRGETISPADIVSVEKGDIEVVFKGSGTITAKQDIKVTSKPSGIVQAIYVREGEYVNKGQKLALIKPGRNEFEDYKALPIYAPVSGTVVKCLNQDDYQKDFSDRDLSLPRLGTFLTGSYDNAEAPSCFLRLVNMDTLIIPMYVTEMQVLKLKEGMPADIKIDSLGEHATPLKGKITYISTQMEKTGRWGDSNNFLVLAELPRDEKNILLGVSASLSIAIEKKENVLTIPANALFEKEGKSYVFKYLGRNKTQQVEIETGLTNDQKVEVIKGLQEDDRVLTELPYGESW